MPLDYYKASKSVYWGSDNDSWENKEKQVKTSFFAVFQFPLIRFCCTTCIDDVTMKSHCLDGQFIKQSLATIREEFTLKNLSLTPDCSEEESDEFLSFQVIFLFMFKIKKSRQNLFSEQK